MFPCSSRNKSLNSPYVVLCVLINFPMFHELNPQHIIFPRFSWINPHQSHHLSMFSYFLPWKIHPKNIEKSWGSHGKSPFFDGAEGASLSSCNSSASKPTMSTASNKSATGTPHRYQGHGDPQQSIEKLYKIVIINHEK